METVRPAGPLLIAGVLTIVYTGVHVFAGGPEIHVPALQSGLTPLVKGVFSVVWHTVTAFMLLNGLALIWASRSPRDFVLVWLVIVQFLAFAGVFVAYGLVRFGDLTTMPQWVGFALIAGVAALGMRRQLRAASMP